MVWVSRARKEWLLLVELVAFSLFTAGDAAGWVESIAGFNPNDRWVFLAGLLIIGLTAIYRLADLQAQLDEREKWRGAMTALTPMVVTGNQLLEMYGRPYSPGQPTDLLMTGLLKIGEWGRAVILLLQTHAQMYEAKFRNAGAIYDDADKKPVAIQELEGRLDRLGQIMDAIAIRI